MSRIEIRPPRWVHLPFLVGDVVLLYVFTRVVFLGGFDSEAAPLGLGLKIVFGFFMAIGVFMFFVLLYRIIKAPLVFSLDSEGVYMNPAGVELGRFKWTEIAEIKETEVIGTRSTRAGVSALPAVAIVLKDPDAYISRFPKIMSPLFKFRERESGTPLLLEPEMFGARYEEIVMRMREEVAKAKARR